MSDFIKAFAALRHFCERKGVVMPVSITFDFATRNDKYEFEAALKADKSVAEQMWFTPATETTSIAGIAVQCGVCEVSERRLAPRHNPPHPPR